MLLLLVLALLLQSAAAATAAALPPADGPALLVFKMHADAGNRMSFNRSFSHCIWPGVACSPEGRVLRFVAEASGLNGTLAPNSLSRLDQLRVLSLKSNSLTGAIPDLSPLLNLKSLFLSRNLLSGPFPPSLLSLHRLRTLDLSHNLLSGAIPLPLSTSLNRLYSLHLESNRLTGALPPLNQTSLSSFNVSYNNLTGPVPVTAALSRFPASAFNDNPGLCGEAVRRECPAHLLFFHGPASAAPAPAAGRGGGGGAQARLEGLLIPDSSSSSSASKKMHKKAAAAVAFLAAVLLMVALIGVMLAIRKKRLAPEEKGGAAVPVAAEMYGEESSINDIEASNNELVAATAVMSEDKVKRMGKSGCLMFCAGEAPVYTLEQLMRASAEMLGRGGVGTTYKAVLDNRLIVCVKRLDAVKMGMTGKEAFERHMDAVGRLRHPNLVPLRAYFQAKEERLLVFDYQPNGSLYSLIHGSRSSRAKPLHWTSCLKIAEDVAQGLAYIHQASRLVHGNIKSSNVLLGPDFEACLTDNCLSFLVEEPSDGEDDSGYRAPETRKSNRRLTPRSDIYAFGVLLLELLTGKPPLQHPVLIATDLPVWVRSVREETTEDERIGMIIDIAAACARSSPESRPTTWQVLKMIQEVKETDTGDNDDDSACIS